MMNDLLRQSRTASNRAPKTLFVIVGVVMLIALALLLLERRPGYGVYYGIAKLTGSPVDIGPVKFETLTRHATPNDALVCPLYLCRNTRPDSVAHTYDLSPDDLLPRLKAVALAEPNVGELYCAQACGEIARFVQYARLMRFPDTVDIAVFPTDGGRATLAIYSRSLIGRHDSGVNAARVKRWLVTLERGL